MRRAFLKSIFLTPLFTAACGGARAGDTGPLVTTAAPSGSKAGGKLLPTRIRQQGYTIQLNPGDSIQDAINFILENVDGAGSSEASIPRIKLADGVYTESVSLQGTVVGGDQIIFEGNLTNPAAVQWRAPTGTNCAAVQDNMIATFRGIDFSAPGGACLVARQGGSVIDFNNVRFGPAGSHINVQVLATVNALGPYTIYGSASTHMLAVMNSVAMFNGVTVTLENNPMFQFFVEAVHNATISFAGAKFIGSAGGSSGLATTHSVISVAQAANVPGTGFAPTQDGGVIVGY